MAAQDLSPFDAASGGDLGGTFDHAALLTKSDTLDLPFVTRGIYVGGAGNVAVITKGGETVTFTAPPVGSVLPIRATRLMSTNTTATLLIGLW